MLTTRQTPTVLPGPMLEALLGSLADSTQYPPWPQWLSIPDNWSLCVLTRRELHFAEIEDRP